LHQSLHSERFVNGHEPGFSFVLTNFTSVRNSSTVRTEHLSGVFVDGFILKEFFFSLEPVVQFRTGLITSADVEFVGPSPDTFFG